MLRPLLGTGEVRFAPGGATAVTPRCATAGGRFVIRRGDGDPARVTSMTTVALDLMRSVKRRLDPARTLSPGPPGRRHLTWPRERPGPPQSWGNARGRRRDRRVRRSPSPRSGADRATACTAVSAFPRVRPISSGVRRWTRREDASCSWISPTAVRSAWIGRWCATGTHASAAWRASTPARPACSTTASSSRCARRSSAGSHATGASRADARRSFAVLPYPTRMRTDRVRRCDHAGARPAQRCCSRSRCSASCREPLRRLDDMAPSLRLADAQDRAHHAVSDHGDDRSCVSRCSPAACRTRSSRT